MSHRLVVIRSVIGFPIETFLVFNRESLGSIVLKVALFSAGPPGLFSWTCRGPARPQTPWICVGVFPASPNSLACFVGFPRPYLRWFNTGMPSKLIGRPHADKTCWGVCGGRKPPPRKSRGLGGPAPLPEIQRNRPGLSPPTCDHPL